MVDFQLVSGYNTTMLYPRNLKSLLLEAIEDTPVVLVNGARQTGKSTLVERLYNVPETNYISFDEVANLSAAKLSPQDFIDNLPDKVILDEIQHVPELFISIKRSVDLNRKPGRFILTGSANVLTLPRLSDSLAGRMEIHTIWPLSQGEINGVKEGFIDTIFGGNQIKFKFKSKLSDTDLINILLRGGYPGAVTKANAQRRTTWFEGYLTTVLQRDVQDLSNIEGLIAMPNLLALLATRSGGLLNFADLSRTLGLPASTLKRYLALLQTIFLIVCLPGWYQNLGKRLIKSPKVYISDTGLLCHLLQISSPAAFKDRTVLGHVLENFVLMELMKQCTWSNVKPQLFHYRSEGGQEIDIILEARDKRLVGIEVKATSSLNKQSFKSLALLRDQVGDSFQCGIVLYTGTNTIGFGERLFAVPISALWETASEPAMSLA